MVVHSLFNKKSPKKNNVKGHPLSLYTKVHRFINKQVKMMLDKSFEPLKKLLCAADTKTIYKLLLVSNIKAGRVH